MAVMLRSCVQSTRHSLVLTVSASVINLSAVCNHHVLMSYLTDVSTVHVPLLPKTAIRSQFAQPASLCCAHLASVPSMPSNVTPSVSRLVQKASHSCVLQDSALNHHSTVCHSTRETDSPTSSVSSTKIGISAAIQ